MWRNPPRAFERLTNAACRRDMVLLDEDAAIESKPMVSTAAASHGVLFDRAQPRMRLAGIDDFRASAFHRLNVAMRNRRDTGHQLCKVERDALAAQQSDEVALDIGGDDPLVQSRALSRQRVDHRLDAGLREDLLYNETAAEDDPIGLLNRDTCASSAPGRNRRGGCYIALPYVLGQRPPDHVGEIELLKEFHNLTRAELTRLRKSRKLIVQKPQLLVQIYYSLLCFENLVQTSLKEFWVRKSLL